ncbi:hypothetical protein NPIL_64171 [Nephila pilipes]|uniref:Uncharacterized protein n=1 Tax=Nephila pilipes TaxID=299642 RepID=A0A8X6TV93_NEPPI|nr:hypothetical protein NPIL_64171 [Nephila pilipes]
MLYIPLPLTIALTSYTTSAISLRFLLPLSAPGKRSRKTLFQQIPFNHTHAAWMAFFIAGQFRGRRCFRFAWTVVVVITD